MIEKTPVIATQAPPDAAAPASRVPRPALVRPALRKLGALPRVTAAFGGSFTP